MNTLTNVVVRFPTQLDPASGQFQLLRNLAGHIVDFAGSGPSQESPTMDVIRAFRSGRSDDELTNQDPKSEQVVLMTRAEGSDAYTETPLPFTWPENMYSLSHVALPFPEDDPLYGRIPSDMNPGHQLGTLELRGERGMTRISATSMLRLHWNPFYDYLEDRVVGFVADPPGYQRMATSPE